MPAARKPKHKTAFHDYAYDLMPAPGADTAQSAVPDCIQLLPASGFAGRDGRGPYEYDGAELMTSFAANGADLPIDVDHISLDTTAPGQGTAYGWIQRIEVRPDGVWGYVMWTEAGRGLVASQGYRYISPVFTFQDAKGKLSHITRLLGAGLTNYPNLHLVALNSEGAGDGYTEDEQPTLDPQMKEQLLALLGLAADATDEAIMAAVTAAHAAVAQLNTATADLTAAQSQLTASAGFSTELVAVQSQLVAAQAEAQSAQTALTAAQAELVSIKTAAHTATVSAAVDGAITAGKFTPAQRDYLTIAANADTSDNLAAFKAFVAATPVLAVAQHSASFTAADETFGLTSDQLATCKSQGIKPELYAKSLKAAAKAA